METTLLPHLEFQARAQQALTALDKYAGDMTALLVVRNDRVIDASTDTIRSVIGTCVLNKLNLSGFLSQNEQYYAANTALASRLLTNTEEFLEAIQSEREDLLQILIVH